MQQISKPANEVIIYNQSIIIQSSFLSENWKDKEGTSTVTANVYLNCIFIVLPIFWLNIQI